MIITSQPTDAWIAILMLPLLLMTGRNCELEGRAVPVRRRPGPVGHERHQRRVYQQPV